VPVVVLCCSKQICCYKLTVWDRYSLEVLDITVLYIGSTYSV
jgi:hypothetical protein